jgi:hypothetical protein
MPDGIGQLPNQGSFPGTSIAFLNGEVTEMRRIAGLFPTILAMVLFCIVPRLYGAEPENKQASSPMAEKATLSQGIADFEARLRLSQPLGLLVFGSALIISADWLSRVLRARARRRLSAPVYVATGNHRTAQENSVPASKS